MLLGDAPFGSSENMSKFEIFNRISESPPSLPLFMGMRLKTLLKGLLDKSDSSRYSFEHVAKSSWLKEVHISLVYVFVQSGMHLTAELWVLLFLCR